MSYEIPFNYLGQLPADVDLSSSQFCGVSVLAATATEGAGVGGAGVILPAVDGDPIIGVLQNNPVVGEACQIMKDGVSKGKCGDTFLIGDKLSVNTAGKFIPATNYVVAIALEDGVVDAVAAVLLTNLGK